MEEMLPSELSPTIVRNLPQDFQSSNGNYIPKFPPLTSDEPENLNLRVHEKVSCDLESTETDSEVKVPPKELRRSQRIRRPPVRLSFE